jgi:membrane-associated protease RseP (regulator of RpoE activity)
MNLVWRKSFEFSYPVDRVYAAYVEVEGSTEPVVGKSFTLTDAAGTRVDITDVRPNERIAYRQTVGDDVAEMTITFESTESGTRITVTRHGFGEGDTFEVFRESHMLGWTEGMADLDLYLRTGVRMRRHLEDRSATGVVFKETHAGLEVKAVTPGSLGEQAGLERGDILLSIDGAVLYGRSHLWLFQRLYEAGHQVEVAYARAGERRTARARMLPVEMAVVGEVGLGPRLD